MKYYLLLTKLLFSKLTFFVGGGEIDNVPNNQPTATKGKDMTTLKKFAIPSTAALVIGSFLASATPGHAVETQLAPTLDTSTSENLLQSPEQAEELLRAIDQIPESVLLEGK